MVFGYSILFFFDNNGTFYQNFIIVRLNSRRIRLLAMQINELFTLEWTLREDLFAELCNVKKNIFLNFIDQNIFLNIIDHQLNRSELWA